MGDTLSTEQVVEILEQANVHRDAIRYARYAEERGGTAILNSMQYRLNHVSVEKFASTGTRIEEKLHREGAPGALECGNLDETNTEICEAIVEDYHS